MKNSCLYLTTALLLSGCAGSSRNFTRVEPEQQLEKSASALAQLEDSVPQSASPKSGELKVRTFKLTDSSPQSLTDPAELSEHLGTSGAGQSLQAVTEQASQTPPSDQAPPFPGGDLSGITGQVTQAEHHTAAESTPVDSIRTVSGIQPPALAANQLDDLRLAPPTLHLPSPAGTSADKTADSPATSTSPESGQSFAVERADEAEQMPAPLGPQVLMLDDIVGSVYSTYPLLQAAFFERNVVQGRQLSAQGEFDLKIKGASENEVLGFYKNYRQSIGLAQPTWNGGEFFAGYRVGNGYFQPWYKNRETNEGGEFRLAMMVPLAQNREIDARRAEVFRTQFERNMVEPDIQAQLIDFVLEASYSYWDWVATGQKYRIARRALELAEDRNDRMRQQVEAGLLDPPQLTDNRRLIAERRTRLADVDRKLRQSASKLSLFLRDHNGEPVIPDIAQLPEFPEIDALSEEQLSLDTQIALQSRPEMLLFSLARRQLDLDLAEANNELKPSVDGFISTSQDIGQRASPINDKGQFEMEASLFVDVPLQRRKALGKIQSVQGKIAQLNVKRKIVEDKIAIDVQLAYAGLLTAYEQSRQADEAVGLAEELVRIEARNLNAGAADLLTVTLREQFAIEAAERAVDARLEYFRALADYRAALGQDQIK